MGGLVVSAIRWIVRGYPMFRKACLLLFVFILIPCISHAEIKTYIHRLNNHLEEASHQMTHGLGLLPRPSVKSLKRPGHIWKV
jgi:hypothetical protein